MTKPRRPIASAVLVLAYALVPASFLAHGHDDGSFDGHDHGCALCCLGDHSTEATTAAAPAPAAPIPLALIAAPTRHRRGFPAAPDPGPTRGPPA